MTEQGDNLQFSPAVARFLQTAASLDQIEAQRRDLKKSLVQDWEEALKERRQLLKTILVERGLELCSYPHSSQSKEPISPEEIGAFPRGQMRLHYQKWTWIHRGDYSSDEPINERQLLMLCPDHFPSVPNIVEGSTFRSEVFERDGKMIALVNAKEINLPISREIEEHVYSYFGLPGLPPKPKEKLILDLVMEKQ